MVWECAYDGLGGMVASAPPDAPCAYTMLCRCAYNGSLISFPLPILPAKGIGRVATMPPRGKKRGSIAFYAYDPPHCKGMGKTGGMLAHMRDGQIMTICWIWGWSGIYGVWAICGDASQAKIRGIGKVLPYRVIDCIQWGNLEIYTSGDL